MLNFPPKTYHFRGRRSAFREGSKHALTAQKSYHIFWTGFKREMWNIPLFFYRETSLINPRILSLSRIGAGTYAVVVSEA